MLPQQVRRLSVRRLQQPLLPHAKKLSAALQRWPMRSLRRRRKRRAFALRRHQQPHASAPRRSAAAAATMAAQPQATHQMWSRVHPEVPRTQQLPWLRLRWTAPGLRLQPCAGAGAPKPRQRANAPATQPLGQAAARPRLAARTTPPRRKLRLTLPSCSRLRRPHRCPRPHSRLMLSLLLRPRHFRPRQQPRCLRRCGSAACASAMCLRLSCWLSFPAATNAFVQTAGRAWGRLQHAAAPFAARPQSWPCACLQCDEPRR